MNADDMCRLVAEIPEAEERETWGHPTFRVRDKVFAGMAEDGATATVKATLAEQEALLGSDPDTFSVAPHVGRFGWVRIELANVDEQELRELVTEAWRSTAPKRLAAQLPGG